MEKPIITPIFGWFRR